MPPARLRVGRQAGSLAPRRLPAPIAATPPAGVGGGGDASAPALDDARIRAAAAATAAAPPRLVNDFDLVRSLNAGSSRGGGDPYLPRAFAPPAEPRVCRCCAGEWKSREREKKKNRRAAQRRGAFALNLDLSCVISRHGCQ